MSFYQTSCRMCRDFRDDLKCAGEALHVFLLCVLFVAAIFLCCAFVVGLVWVCIDQDAPWHAAGVVSLGVYWGIYRDIC
jgi:hypothetical protein